MTIALTAFTARGLALAQRLADGLNAQDDTAAVTPCFGPEHLSLADFTANAFAQADALVFVGAAGIAVRAIAPHLSSKTRDPAVVVLDETGAFAVSLLSGHLGGANALTLRLAGLCGAQPVITTATDRSGLWAADDWARKNGCAVAEPERIKQVSGALLAGGSLALFSEFSIGGVWPRGLHPAACAAKAQVVLSLSDTDPDGARPLHLVPRIAVLGVGCRKGTPAGQILELLSDFLARAQVSRRALCRVCSIDLKAREPGLLEACRMLGLPARYVVGYAAPQSLFAESDGGWQAVLQDDNAHAWAEVYLAGQGWTPLETTPGMLSELTEDQLAANANAVPTADDTETPLPAATPAPEADPTAPQARAFWWLLPLAAVLAALAVWGIARARRTPADTVRAEFRALYKKMCRCGLSEGVSSDQEEFKQFLREHTKTAAPQDVETLLALVQTAQFAPGPVSAQTAQQVRGLCRILRKNLHR